MDSLRSVIPGVLRKRGLFKHAEASHVTFSAQRWIEMMLPRFKGDIAVQELSDATLTISCRHSIASQECTPLITELQEYLAHEFPTSRILEIRLIRAKK